LCAHRSSSESTVPSADATRTWFRFHHLFADLLAVELRHTEPGEILRLHLAAAGWYAEHGLITEAIARALVAGDREQAAGLLIGHYFSLMLDGRQTAARVQRTESSGSIIRRAGRRRPSPG
jgi:LuxR family transcriptional regulator, maltose regulon positive regulatory protein